jgi:DNA-binding MarR family transcriptional regulator
VHRTAARCVEILLGESPLSAGELAERVGVSRSGTTPLLDRLEDAGVIQRRRASDEDRRRVAIELTTVGRTIAQQFWDGVFQRLTRLAQQYSREDLEVVQDFLTRANAILSGSEPPPRMERQPDAPSVPRSGHVGNPQQARPPTLAIERRAALGRRGPTLGSQSDAEQAPG